MTDLPITAIISTKDEARAIASCIESLTGFDEVIVVDSESTDGTADIARANGVPVVNFAWNGSYPKKKQWCLDNLATRHQWIFFFDADERPEEGLLTELQRHFTTPPSVAAFDVRVRYHFEGRELRHGHKVVKRALLERTRVRFPRFDDIDAPGMGELEGHYQPETAGHVARLSHRIIHDDPDPLRTWIARHNNYGDWEAYLRAHSDLRQEVRSHRSRQGRVFERVPGKPLFFFLYSYVLRRGFLDGRAGFGYAFALSFYYWSIDAKVRELRRSIKDS